MPTTHVKARHIPALNEVEATPATLAMKTAAGATITGYVSPNLQSIQLSHECDVEEIKNQVGDVAAIITRNERLKLTIEFIPQGTSYANAKEAATILAPNCFVTIAGMPIIEVGSFADALNSADWHYGGGAQITGPSDQRWSATIELTRYAAVTAGNQIA